MANKIKSKYKKGDKFTIEIAEVHTHYTDNGKPFSLYRIKGFSALVFDDKGLDIIKNNEPTEVDWSKVPIDTPILVKDYGHDVWNKRHFAGLTSSGKVKAWNNGSTSKTSFNDGDYVTWDQAKIMEE